jgi:hypothetical protein
VVISSPKISTVLGCSCSMPHYSFVVVISSVEF